MSYEPTNWKSGDVVTSAKLNKLEQGVVEAGSNIEVLTVTENEGTYTLNKTWAELLAGASQGKLYYLARTDTPSGDGYYLKAGFLQELSVAYGVYSVYFGMMDFESSTEDGPLVTNVPLN